MKESSFTKKALPKWQEKHPRAKLYRNNTGTAWQGKRSKLFCNGVFEWILKKIRIISFGVGLPVKDKKTGRIKQKGGGDYIGWETKRICDLIKYDELHVICNFFHNEKGCTNCPLDKNVAVFLSLEIKTKDGKESPEQIDWRKKVIEAGGIATVLREGR